MKIHGRTNYKAGPKDEWASPPYAIVPLIDRIYYILYTTTKDKIQCLKR
jgi:hypothetical protein